MKTKAKAKITKKSKKNEGLALTLNEQIWPIERDVFFRPDRLKYVRKIIKPKGCVFCAATQEEMSFKNLCVYKTKHSAVVLNKFPYNSGHLLIVPRRHCGDILALSQEEYTDLQNLVRLSMKALMEVYECQGINTGMNHGAVSGAGIPEHLHYHVIPRWAGDLNFFPIIAEVKVVIESLENTYDRMFEYFKKVSK